MNVVQIGAVKVMCTEFEPECDLVDTTVTVFAATVLSTVHADPSVVPLSKPSQNTAAAGHPAPPSPEDASPNPPPLSAPPPSPLPPASSIDIIIAPLEPLDPPVMTPLPFPPDELLLAPPLLLLLLPAPTLPPLLEDEPTCVIVTALPLDEPLCSTEPASGLGDGAVPPQATNAKQPKPRAIVRPAPQVQGEPMGIRSPRVMSVQWRLG
jgi:hypothetical protein